MSLSEISVRRPVTVVMATLALSIFGWLAAQRLPVELLPDLSYPTLTVQTVYPDAAPVSVEQFVTRPIEESVGVIPGVRNMRSTSRAGLSEVVLEFEWDEEMDFVALDVLEKLGLVELPREAEVPRVLRFDPALEPVMRLAFTGERPLDELRQLAVRWVKPRLEAVEGVAAAKVRGGLDAEVQVEADEDRLAALGLTLDDLARALQSENVNQPGGTLKDWGALFLVRTFHEFSELDQLRRTVVREGPTGRVRVEDVAEVRHGHRDRDEITRSAGREIVELALHREGSSNTLAVAAAIGEELTRLGEAMPRDLRLEVLTDQSRYIADAVGEVWTAALLGGVLAVLVLYFYLRDLSSTAIIALTIPISVLITFLPMQRAGVTFNIMSLGGLALGVGNLVDNSIVVLEAIDRRRREGRKRREAAIAGAREVAGAVTASTLTTICVFLPVVFVEGVAGQLFYDLAVTVCVSQVASLIVGLTLIPSFAAIDFSAARQRGRETLFLWDQEDDAAAEERPPLAAGAWRFAIGGLAERRSWGVLLLNLLLLPLRLLALALSPILFVLQWVANLLFPLFRRIRWGRFAYPILGNGRHPTSRLGTLLLTPVALALLILVPLLLGLWWIVSRIFRGLTSPLSRAFDALSTAYPATLTSALRHRHAVIAVGFCVFVLALAAVPYLGTSLVPDLAQGEFAFRLALPPGTPLETTAEVVEHVESSLTADPRFARVFSVVGSVPSSASARQTLGENLAQLNFVLPEGATGNDEAAAVVRVREVLELFLGLEADLARPAVLTIRPPVAIQIFADDLERLDQGALEVAAAVGRVPGVEDVTTTVEAGNPEIRVEIDRERASALGVQADGIGRSLRRQIRGEVVGQFRDGEERLDIRLRASERSRDRAASVESLRIRLPNGTVVPISSVAQVIVERGPAAIHRAGGARMAEITAKTTATDLGGVLGRVREATAAVRLPTDVVADFAGQDEELRVSFDSLKLMLALAIFLVYVVMAMQFESFLHPFVILLAVPLGIVGAVAALLVTGTSVNVLALIGVVMLSGIVVNNAIILVDAVNQRRRDGQPTEQAIVGAGRERLRPILMTTSTTVLGLVPMALDLGAGDELRTPLAITFIGGLSVSTALTLFLIPCLYRTLSGERRGPAPAAAGEALGEVAPS